MKLNFFFLLEQFWNVELFLVKCWNFFQFSWFRVSSVKSSVLVTNFFILSHCCNFKFIIFLEHGGKKCLVAGKMKSLRFCESYCQDTFNELGVCCGLFCVCRKFCPISTTPAWSWRRFWSTTRRTTTTTTRTTKTAKAKKRRPTNRPEKIFTYF